MKPISIIVAFIAIITILYFGISMFASIPAPEAGTQANQTYTNLTNIVNLSFTGMQGVILLLLAVMVIAAVTVLMKAIK